MKIFLDVHFPPKLTLIPSVHEIFFGPSLFIFWKEINRCDDSTGEIILEKYFL